MNPSFRSVIVCNAGELADVDVILETVRAVLAEHLPNADLATTLIVDSRQETLEHTLTQLADEQPVSLVLTVGGIDPTGYVGSATQVICHKLFPGFGTILRQTALQTNPASILWCNTAGLRHQTLVVNLPDSVEAIQVGLPLLFPAIPNAVRLAGERIG